MNKNGGYDLVQCSLICHFLPSKIADELLSFCLLISDLFVLFCLFVCFFFYFPLGTKPGLIAAVVVLAILVVVLIAFVCRLKGQLKAEKTASVPSEYETSKLIHSSRCV